MSLTAQLQPSQDIPPGVLTRGLQVVPVGTSPSALAITPNGGLLYVANASTLSVSRSVTRL